VLLREEMNFLQDYFSLLTIRFEKAVRLNMNIPDEKLDQFLIPPISLQVLAENAIKHNEFNDMNPLLIDMKLEEDRLSVQNNLRKKVLTKPSSRIGLQNLNERYLLTTNKSIQIQEDEKEFTVTLPVLQLS
jgi:LytS/YehU family sensor histidine kinase